MPRDKIQNVLLIFLSFAFFLEFLSWWTASMQFSCLIQMNASEQAAHHYGQKDCPTFFSGMFIILERLNHFIEVHEKSIIAAFTVVLAAFTGTLWWSTHNLWRAGEQQIAVARIAANAALRQSNAMIALEVPIFAISALKLVAYENEQSAISIADPVPPGLPPPFCRILIGLQNRGRTEMTINRIFCDWVVAPTVDEMPEYHFQEIWNGALGKESSAWYPSQNGLRLNVLEAEHIGNFGRFLWVYGKIVYTDFMGDQFEHGFIARWTMDQGFIRDPLANYEYKRKI